MKALASHPEIASHSLAMGKEKRIKLVAHDYRKIALNNWAEYNQHIIAFHSGAIGGLMRGGNDIVRFKQLQ